MVCFKLPKDSTCGNLYELISAANGSHKPDADSAIKDPIVLSYKSKTLATRDSITVLENQSAQITKGHFAMMGYLTSCVPLVAFSLDKKNLDTWVFHVVGGCSLNAGGTFWSHANGHYLAYLIASNSLVGYAESVQRLVSEYGFPPDRIIIVYPEKSASDIWIYQNGDFFYF